MSEAELARFIDRYTVEYVRTYPHPIERVWRAIVDPAEISVWFWTAKIDARLGGAFAFGGEDSPLKGVITAFEPPRLIRFSDPPAGEEAYLQFALTSVEDGTRLNFIQHGTPGFVPDGWPSPGLLSGWHGALDHLKVLMDGGLWRPAEKAEADALDQRYLKHRLAALS